MRWSLAARDEDGSRRPFSAAAVFVRLPSKTGAGAKVGFASSNAHAAALGVTFVRRNPRSVVSGG